MSLRDASRAAIVPGLAFLAVVAAHFTWLGLYPEADPIQSQWALLPASVSWWQGYLESGSHWLGYSYGLAAAFAAAALRNFWRERSRASRNLALGGVGLTGSLAAAGCFLIGCCGSPLLAVWLGLFGAGFLPFAKPAAAAVTTLTVAAGWWWMGRGRHRAAATTGRRRVPGQPG